MKHIYIMIALFLATFSYSQCRSCGTVPADEWDTSFSGNNYEYKQIRVNYPYCASTSDRLMAISCEGTLGMLPQSLDAYLSGYTPTARTITINGTSFDLSGNRAWSNVGIELPSQAGNANKVLQTNGTSASWVTPTASFTYSAPSTATSITSGTAFQPRSGGACNLNINSQMTGLVGVAGTITIGISATSGGTYTTVASDSALISVLNQTLDRSSPTISVPAGYWVKVTYAGTGTITGTYTRTDIN